MLTRTRVLIGDHRDWVRPNEALARLATGLGGHEAARAVLIGLLSEGKLVARASRILTETFSDLAAVAGRRSNPGTTTEETLESPPKALIVEADFWTEEFADPLDIDDLGPWFSGEFTTKFDVEYLIETTTAFDVRLNLSQIERLLPGDLSIKDGRQRSGKKRSSNWDLWTAELVKLARSSSFKVWSSSIDVEKKIHDVLQARKDPLVDKESALRTIRATLNLLQAAARK